MEGLEETRAIATTLYKRALNACDTLEKINKNNSRRKLTKNERKGKAGVGGGEDGATSGKCLKEVTYVWCICV